MKTMFPARLTPSLPLALALIGLGAPLTLPAATSPGRIVYYQFGVQGEDKQTYYQIFSVSPNGGGRMQLTRTVGSSLLPDLSPDGKKVAFASDLAPGGIFTMNPDGTGIAHVITGYYRAVWSPDGSRLALVGGPYGANVWTCNPDGSGLQQVTFVFQPVVTSAPTWSPDGSRIAVSGYDYADGSGASADGIYVASATGAGGAARITSRTSDLRDPSWSPDGTKIACIGSAGSVSTNNGGAYTVNPVTGTATLLYAFTDNQYDFNLHWSPDGAQLCFQGNNTEGHALGVVNADGTGRHILGGTGQAIEPHWSFAGGVSGDSITIPGTADVHNADIAAVDFTTPGGVGRQPVSIDVTARAGNGAVTFPAVTGGAFIDINSNNGSTGPNPPDGGPYFTPQYLAALHGISGYSVGTSGALIGVFLAYDDAQTGGNAPPSLDFTSYGLGTDFKALSPALGQVFFIGDGKASDGTVQKFNVPAQAGILLLGVSDGGDASQTPQTARGYNDNGGSFNATYAFTDPGVAGPPSADLVTTVTPSATSAAVGDEIIYTIKITNNGPAAATNLRGAFAGPTGADQFTFLSSTNGGIVTASGNTVLFYPANLSYNPVVPVSTEVKLTLRVNTAGTFTGVTGILGDQTDPTPLNATGSATIVVQPATGNATAADLALSVVASPGTVAVGGRVSYTFTLVNRGPALATNILGGFQKDPRMTFVVDGSQSGVTVVGDLLSFPLPAMSAGTTPTIYTLVFTADQPGVYNVNGGVKASQTDPDPTNNLVSATTTATASGTVGVTPVITGALEAQVLLGDAFFYQIKTDGTAPVDRYDARNLPAGLTVNPTTGLISGTVLTGATTGPLGVTLLAYNGDVAGAATRVFTLVAPPTGKAPNVTGSVKKIAIKPAGQGLYKVSGQYKLKNLGNKAAQNLKVGVYLAKDENFTFPIADDPAAVGLLPLAVKLTAELDGEGSPVYGVKVSIPGAGVPAPVLNLPIKLAKKGKDDSSFALAFTLKASATDLPAQVLSGQYRYLLIVLDPDGELGEASKSNNTAVVDLLTLLGNLLGNP